MNNKQTVVFGKICGIGNMLIANMLLASTTRTVSVLFKPCWVCGLPRFCHSHSAAVSVCFYIRPWSNAFGRVSFFESNVN